MVSLSEIQSSNSQISTHLPAGLVAVFAGATRGIGEFTLLQFAKNAVKPRVYLIGRSKENGERVAAACKKLNPEGEFIFKSADLSLLKSVDVVCREIKEREKSINLLFLTAGTLNFGTKTPEDLHFATCLPHYSRHRLTVNFLPELQHATALRRVVSVFVGGYEGAINFSDMQGLHYKNPLNGRAHGASCVSLSLETISKQAPDVSFIHEFPGYVKTEIAKDMPGFGGFAFRNLAVLASFMAIPDVESGERHLYLATSARYPPRDNKGIDAALGVPVEKGLAVVTGTDGKAGSGVYSVNQKLESAGASMEKVLKDHREHGAAEKVWNDVQAQFKRITGVEAI